MHAEELEIELATHTEFHKGVESRPFYCLLEGRREVGFIPAPDPLYHSAAEVIEKHKRTLEDGKGTISFNGPVPPVMPVPHQTVRQWLTDGGSWGLYDRLQR